MKIPCVICGTTFKKSLNKKTCSRACANKQRTGITYAKGKGGAPRKNIVASQAALRKRVFERSGPQCQKCGYDNANILQCHHILPKKSGGGDEIENLMLLCPNCHCEIHQGDSRTLEDDSQSYQI